MTLSEHAGEPTMFPTTLTAYRTWTYTTDKITALNRTPWPTGWFDAGCLKVHTSVGIALAYTTIDSSEKHQAPVDGCTCGIYARWRPDDLSDLASGIMTNYIAGAIEIKGVVLPGYRGMRAQQARIKAICPVSALDLLDTIPFLAHKYKVPFFSSMRELVKHYPPENLEALGIEKETEPSEEDQRIFYIAAATNMQPQEVKAIIEKYKTGNGNYVIPAGAIGFNAAFTISSDGIIFTNTAADTAVTTSSWGRNYYSYYMTGRQTSRSALQNIILGPIQ